MNERDDYFAHETAAVDDGARIGRGTKIWHFCHVRSEAVIGEGCTLGQNCYVDRVEIGDGVSIQNDVAIYEGVRLEDDVFVGPSAVFTNVSRPRAHVDRSNEYETTIVRCGATIGANATVVCGVEIGEYAFVGAGGVVTEDVVPHALVVGNPAERVGWVCRCGERLAFDETAASCDRCGDEYELAEGSVDRLER